MRIFKQFYNMKSTYGLKFAIIATILRFFSQEKYNRYVFNRLDNEYSTKAKSCNYLVDSSFSDIINVWVFWWQGVDDCPELVKKCINSMYYNFDKSKFKLNFIDKNNIKQFCEFPDYIYDKVESKKISLTHFSDLVRANLLFTYGGLWIDSTVFVLKKIPYDYFDKYDFFTIITNESKRIINGRWTGFFMYTKKNYSLGKFLYDCFLDYWSKHDNLVVYLLIDFLIAVYEKNNLNFSHDLKRIEQSNKNLWDLLYSLNNEFDEKKWNTICSNSYFLKLSYKDSINGGKLILNKNNCQTYWCVISSKEKE